jgi:hypothetical protein
MGRPSACGWAAGPGGRGFAGPRLPRGSSAESRDRGSPLPRPARLHSPPRQTKPSPAAQRASRAVPRPQSIAGRCGAGSAPEGHRGREGGGGEGGAGQRGAPRVPAVALSTVIAACGPPARSPLPPAHSCQPPCCLKPCFCVRGAGRGGARPAAEATPHRHPRSPLAAGKAPPTGARGGADFRWRIAGAKPKAGQIKKCGAAGIHTEPAAAGEGVIGGGPRRLCGQGKTVLGFVGAAGPRHAGARCPERRGALGTQPLRRCGVLGPPGNSAPAVAWRNCRGWWTQTGPRTQTLRRTQREFGPWPRATLHMGNPREQSPCHQASVSPCVKCGHSGTGFLEFNEMVPRKLEHGKGCVNVSCRCCFYF